MDPLSSTQEMNLVRSLLEAKKGNYEQEFLEKLTDEEHKLISPHLKVSVAINDEEIIISKNKDSINSEPSTVENPSKTWSIFEKWMNEKSGLPKSAIDEYNRSTANIQNLLENSENEKIYGLIVGHVQSGKTGHYTSLLPKLADSGFTFVIILSNKNFE